MPDSSWQHSVLRELGVAQRGLTAFGSAATVIADAGWGAEAAEHSARRPSPPPAVQEPLAAPPTPQPVAAEAEQPKAYDPFPDPPQQGQGQGEPEQPRAYDPFPDPPPQQGQGQPEPEQPKAYDPFPDQPQPGQPEAEQPKAYDPFPDAPQQATAEAEQPKAYDPFPDAPQQGQGQGQAQEEPEQPRAYDPFPDQPQQGQGEPEQPQGYESVPDQPQPGGAAQPAVEVPEPRGEGGSAPQRAGAEVPLVNEEFGWEAAISPVGGAGPQAPGLAQAPGGAAGDDEGQEQEAASQQVAPVPGPVSPPQQQGAGAVPAADDFVRKNQHGDALMRRMGRGMRKAVGASGQIRSQAEIAEYLRRPVGGFRQMAVVSVRGGAGKTTVAALLATELARHRPDRVLAMDADAELGSLPLRLGVRSELSLFDLAAQQPRTFEEAAQYLQQTREGLWVLAATRGGRITGEFTFETYQAAFSTVSRYISTAVTDCSAGILTELHRGILGQSHSVVLVTPGTVDGALSARGALEWFAQGGQQSLLARTVIAMVSHAPQVGADLTRATEMLTQWGTQVVHVPYDRHIAMGAAVDLSRLGDATQAAVSRIAYEAFARALGDVPQSH